mmetsp:Transcript_8750/g.19620  ORF Transcript_8750/g.19620 Transcript_8750/m.19620 type:complete len:1054 (+) Transcript_8750:126-3287(+)|eukprot:CAMPEP_0172305884 /NCGR_PEP_ID=MMETSP1058-20130122/7092_1 /TAXON_ID=83371 /ORGANISM="Detonula confervacea, Strain CCMP 353" /LENGTH=1053 /DNA_ID=CAMNT_0013017615 /DNA_START=66 /DNA_END=3227 /DNA_ORIENTATION=-
MSNDSNNIDDDEQLAKAKSILQTNQKVFLRHSHSPGYLHTNAQWSGEYHLATVQQSYDASTNSFKVLWKRSSGNDGHTNAAKTVTYTLDSPTQVLVDVNYKNMTVQIEDDDNGNVHTAKIVNLCDGSGSGEGEIIGRQGEVKIKWDAGYEQLVNVSQVSFGCRRRRKRRSAATAVTTTAAKQRGGVAKTRKKWKKLAKSSPKKKVDETIEIITIDSSSSEEEDERDQRKRPWVTEEHNDTSQIVASSSSVESKTASQKVVRKSFANQDEEDEEDEEKEKDRADIAQDKPTNIFIVPTATRRLFSEGNDFPTTATGRLFSEDDLRSYRVNYEPHAESNNAASAASEGQGIVEEKSPAETATSSTRSDESETAPVSSEGIAEDGSPTATTTSSLGPDESETVAPWKKSLSTTQENSSTNSLPSYESSEEDDASSWGQNNCLTQAEEDAEEEGEDEVEDEIEDEAAASTVSSKSILRERSASDDSLFSSDESSELEVADRERAATSQESSATTSSLCSDEESDGVKFMGTTPKRILRKRKAKENNSTTPDNEGKKGVVARKSAKRVTPQSSRTASSILSSDENEEASSVLPKRSHGVTMHGFCRSVPQMKNDPHQTIEVIQNMLDKAKECTKGSDELRETMVDAHMLIQEQLFNLDERTKFVNAPNSNKATSSMPEKDGNKSHIIRLAKRFGLTQQQMDILFKRLDVDDGYYSIDDAIPKIMEMKKNNTSNTLEESDEENDNDADIATADNGQKEKQLELLGSRVKTVFEDGREYEGTISTVHYRVTYDDDDTETFVSEAEAFENLACNNNITLNGSSSCDGIRCSALEIFSGCSILSTLCKRKGMNVMSIDNDPNSNATVKGDFSSDYVQSILATQSFDYIHASPVCSTYSFLAGGKHRGKDNYNKTPKSHEADSMLTLFYFFIAKELKSNNSRTVTIENPRGWMKKGNIMKELFEGELGFKRFEIKYCQFGRADQKPTNIWTNDLKLGDILETVGGKCDCPLPHEESVKGRNGSSNSDKNFAALPLKLCQLITTYVHSKHTQLNFEKLAPNAPS